VSNGFVHKTLTNIVVTLSAALILSCSLTGNFSKYSEYKQHRDQVAQINFFSMYDPAEVSLKKMIGDEMVPMNLFKVTIGKRVFYPVWMGTSPIIVDAGYQEIRIVTECRSIVVPFETTKAQIISMNFEANKTYTIELLQKSVPALSYSATVKEVKNGLGQNL